MICWMEWLKKFLFYQTFLTFLSKPLTKMSFLHIKCIFQGSTCDFSTFFCANRLSLTWFFSQLKWWVNLLDGTVRWKICTTKYNFVICFFNFSNIEWQLITCWKITILYRSKGYNEIWRKRFPFLSNRYLKNSEGV